MGIRDIRLKEKMLRCTTLALEEAVRICVAQETTPEQMKVFRAEEVSVDATSTVQREKSNSTRAGGQEERETRTLCSADWAEVEIQK